MKKSSQHAYERTTAQRFEAKYVISEVQALAITDFIGPYVNPDPYAREYPVTSLYLDSPSLAMYWSSETGEKNRHKLRIRSYGDDVPQTVFFEIKRRVDQVVKKHRAAVCQPFVETCLAGGPVTRQAMAKPEDSTAMAALLRFRDVKEALSARPLVGVRYLREAFVSSLDEPVRITFDRNLSYLPCPIYSEGIWSSRDRWRNVGVLSVILEIKFTDSFPSWVTRLVRRFHLIRDSFAKYVHCVKSLRVTTPLMAGTMEATRTWSR